MGKLIVRSAAVILSAALLASCSSGSDPAPSTTPAMSPAPAPQTTAPPESPSPTVAPTVETVRPEIDIPEPEMHPDMAHDDIDGAESAARYFLDLYGYVYNTGDLNAWNKLSDPECVKCTYVTEQVESQYAQGHWYENFALLHGEAIRYYPSADLSYYLVVVEVLNTENEHFGPSGKIIEETAETFFAEYMIGVQYRGPNEWKVMGASAGEGEDW